MINLKERTFLIAESVQEMRMALTLALSTLGARKVETVAQSKEVLRRLEYKSYDVVICDFTFGGKLDGLALLQELNQRRLIKPGTVFIIATAERSAAKIMSALDYSPDDYLLKPFTADLLQKRVVKAIRRRPVFAVVNKLIQEHDYQAALAECEKRIGEGGEHQVEFMKLKGRLSLITSDFEGAQKLYEQVLETAPAPWATMGLGKSLQNQQEFDKAIELFQSIIADNSQVMEAYDLLAESHQANGDPKEAQEVLQKAVAVLPNDLKRQQRLGEVAWENGDFEVAERSLLQCLALGKEQFSNDPDSYIKLCKLRLDKNDFETALATLQDLRKAIKEPVPALYATLIEAIIYKKQGDDDKARGLYDKVRQAMAEQKPLLPENMQLDLITAGLVFGDPSSSEKLVRQLMHNNTEGSPIRKKIEALYEKEGKKEQIQSLIKTILAELVALNNRAVTLAKSGDLKGAVELFIQAVTDMPNNVRFLINATNALLAYVNLVDWNEDYMNQAKDHIERIGELDPVNPAFQQLTKLRAATVEKFASRQEAVPS